jgi:hypothetical protein
MQMTWMKSFVGRLLTLSLQDEGSEDEGSTNGRKKKEEMMPRSRHSGEQQEQPLGVPS